MERGPIRWIPKRFLISMGRKPSARPETNANPNQSKEKRNAVGLVNDRFINWNLFGTCSVGTEGRVSRRKNPTKGRMLKIRKIVANDRDCCRYQIVKIPAAALDERATINRPALLPALFSVLALMR